MQNSFRFFENKECQFYPCHDMECINCLFCYCPLYSIENCGGNCTWLDGVIKDCSNCSFPHVPDNYDCMMERLTENNRLKQQKKLFQPVSNDIE